MYCQFANLYKQESTLYKQICKIIIFSECRFVLSLLLKKSQEFQCSWTINQIDLDEIFIVIYSFYLCIYPPDSQESDGGANDYKSIE